MVSLALRLRQVLSLLKLLRRFSGHWCCCWRRLPRIWPLSCGKSLAARVQYSVSHGRRAIPGLAREDEVEIPVQINGKLVSVIRVPAGSDAKVIEAAALAEEKVKARIAGKNVIKIIVVPGRAVNLVVK